MQWPLQRADRRRDDRVRVGQRGGRHETRKGRRIHRVLGVQDEAIVENVDPQGMRRCFGQHVEKILTEAQLVSRANSDVGLLQGLLMFMPIMLGNLVFLLIFGMPAERKLGSLRLLILFLLGGAVANLATALTIDNPSRLIIGASGSVSAIIGTYLALFPRARLGVVIPLGLFLEFVRAPASLLIGIWALLQVGFAYIGPAFGEVAWVAHLAGLVFGLVFAFLQRGAIARRLRRQSGY